MSEIIARKLLNIIDNSKDLTEKKKEIFKNYKGLKFHQFRETAPLPHLSVPALHNLMNQDDAKSLWGDIDYNACSFAFKKLIYLNYKGLEEGSTQAEIELS
ncbi:MAG TPA: hypothetical protein VF691_22055 [Cytophagaceae bacterium]|jgi:uncharacterized linocin/CFP29 family protein